MEGVSWGGTPLAFLILIATNLPAESDFMEIGFHYDFGEFFGATNRAFLAKQEGESNSWLAERFYDEFFYHFDECMDEEKGVDKYPEIEGLILRLKNSKLHSNPKRDVEWIMRCRKPKNKVYDF